MKGGFTYGCLIKKFDRDTDGGRHGGRRICVESATDRESVSRFRIPSYNETQEFKEVFSQVGFLARK